MSTAIETLPDKPSELLRMALDDTLKAEKAKGYEVRMGFWHSPNPCSDKEICLVCMAGAVMSNRLKADPKHSLSPDSFNRDTALKLDAVDNMRVGAFYDALISLKINNMPGGLRHQPALYHRDRPQFLKDMNHNIRILRKAGL